MTNSKREAKDYAVEKTIETVKIIEAMQGDRFEPVGVDTIIERVGIIPDRSENLKPDAVRRILITLELLGYAKQTNRKWTVGKNAIRFAQSIVKNQV